MSSAPNRTAARIVAGKLPSGSARVTPVATLALAVISQSRSQSRPLPLNANSPSTEPQTNLTRSRRPPSKDQAHSVRYYGQSIRHILRLVKSKRAGQRSKERVMIREPSSSSTTIPGPVPPNQPHSLCETLSAPQEHVHSVIATRRQSHRHRDSPPVDHTGQGLA